MDKIKESSEFIILRIPEPVDLWNFTNTHCKSFFEEFLMDHQKGGVNLQLLIFSSYLQTEMDIVEQIKTLRQAGEVRYIILLQESKYDLKYFTHREGKKGGRRIAEEPARIENHVTYEQ